MESGFFANTSAQMAASGGHRVHWVLAVHLSSPAAAQPSCIKIEREVGFTLGSTKGAPFFPLKNAEKYIHKADVHLSSANDVLDFWNFSIYF